MVAAAVYFSHLHVNSHAEWVCEYFLYTFDDFVTFLPTQEKGSV